MHPDKQCKNVKFQIRIEEVILLQNLKVMPMKTSSICNMETSKNIINQMNKLKRVKHNGESGIRIIKMWLECQSNNQRFNQFKMMIKIQFKMLKFIKCMRN